MEFVLERYNYWIIIILMMGGLYIVFEAENMIKKLVGLGIFQTSVLFFYVTLGKTAGGTAPIQMGAHGGHGDEHHSKDGAHGAAGHAPVLHAPDKPDEMAPPDTMGEGGHEGTAHAHALDAENSHGDAHHEASHHADAGGQEMAGVEHGVADHSSHANHAVAEHGHEAGHDATHGVEAAHDVGHDAAHDVIHGASEVIYSNPLPHVLMLTAIVVGVATLSVGLALVVRVREAYGSIEMDEIRNADIAESEAEGEAA